ncbi:MAG: hypothetical protein C0601_08925 [Candidatus Muiribacterium halophilum]|uniref:Adenosine monophosphate-protein transferase n=1 Tax=Muiribacterium halophilum TaxID=2053465 RepID=A0A2N5ZE09_MUIH1|nr:MAG: hypothetical protein C0601_08925 [Candidatus Muirbacterium halophilum]
MIKNIPLENPNEYNMIFGQSHFIKTIEDLREAIVNTVPGAKFGIAFSEASGPCLVRFDGNDQELTELAVKNVEKVQSGHCFMIFLKEAFPINLLPTIKRVPEIANIFCATANPVDVIVFEAERGNAVLGVIDGFKPKGVETPEDKKVRYEFLRKIGYKN